MTDENTFTCEACGQFQRNRPLKKRDTMPGNYCTNCAKFEKCAACGDCSPKQNMNYKPGIKTYVCHECMPYYEEMKSYIL